ncbi:hypothetical protein [Pigmentiphaga sp.]|nr:hypothetical protein [Pigmentiphaga sp.]
MLTLKVASNSLKKRHFGFPQSPLWGIDTARHADQNAAVALLDATCLAA